MSNSARTINLVRKCKLTNMVTRQGLKEQRNSRIFQIRQQLAQDLKESAENIKIKI